jgi:hypothetical protein
MSDPGVSRRHAAVGIYIRALQGSRDGIWSSDAGLLAVGDLIWCMFDTASAPCCATCRHLQLLRLLSFNRPKTLSVSCSTEGYLHAQLANGVPHPSLLQGYSTAGAKLPQQHALSQRRH